MKKAYLFLVLLALLFTGTRAQAAVDSVSFKILYNASTCKYDVYMTVLGGHTTAGGGRSAYPGQLTIVVPTGSTVNGIVSNEPKSGSRNGAIVTRTTPTTWSNSNIKMNYPGALSGFDAYAFTPGVSNAFYDSLNTNDVVLLFSVKILSNTCGAGIRMWNNNEVMGTAVSGGDPTSDNYENDDYNNGIGIGSPTQRYKRNGISDVTPPNPMVNSVTPTCTSNSFSLTASANPGSSCASPLTYAWTGPNGFTNSSASFTITSPTAANSGTYRLTIKDANACMAVFAQGYNAINCALLPLPIRLSAFDGSANKCTAVLSWQTAEAPTFKDFEVQYSNDGSRFETVGTVSSVNVSGGSSYTFNYDQASGRGYYRLKVIDIDGKDTYSKTISIVTSCDAQQITISPNPTSGNIYVKGIAAGDEVKVMDMVGQIVTSTKSQSDVAMLDLSAYAPGVYEVLVVKGQTAIKAGQVVKQ